MGWWTDPVGGKKEPAKKSGGWWSQPVGGPKKCGVCGKTAGCKCGNVKNRKDMKQPKVKVIVKDKKGWERTVTKNAPYKVDKGGIAWCTSCSCRVIKDRCTNITCSTRR